MTPTSNVDTLPGGRLHLLSLPTELQGIIFDFAYHRDASIKLMPIFKLRLNQSLARQDAKPSEDPPPLRLPQIKISEFLVSKQYLVAAARAYAGGSPIIFEDSFHRDNSKVLLAFVREAEAHLFTWAHVTSSKVQKLRLLISPTAFLSVSERDGPELPVLRQRMHVADFLQSPMSEKLDHIRGVKVFELVASDLSNAYDQEQKDNWKANMKTFEDLLRPKVTRDRDEADAAGAKGDSIFPQMPLYPGSNVFWERMPMEKQDTRSLFSPETRMQYLIKGLADLTPTEYSRVEKAMEALFGPEERAVGSDVADQDTTSKVETVKEPRKILEPKSRKAVARIEEAESKAPAEEHTAAKEPRKILVPKSRKVAMHTQPLKMQFTANEGPVCESSASKTKSPAKINRIDARNITIVEKASDASGRDTVDSSLQEVWRMARADMQAMAKQAQDTNADTKLAMERLTKAEQASASMDEKLARLDAERAKQMQQLETFFAVVKSETDRMKTSGTERKVSVRWKISLAFVVGAVMMWMCMVGLAYHADTHGANGLTVYGSIRDRRW